jgi:hypothetical protein
MTFILSLVGYFQKRENTSTGNKSENVSISNLLMKVILGVNLT